MIKSTDIEGRLRLFRYGLVVIVVVTFLLSLLAPFAVTNGWAPGFNQLADAVNTERVEVSIATFLPFALGITVVVAIVMVVIYFVYRAVLQRTITPETAAK